MAKYTGVTQNKDGSWSYRIKKKVDGKVIDTKIKKDDGRGVWGGNHHGKAKSHFKSHTSIFQSIFRARNPTITPTIPPKKRGSAKTEPLFIFVKTQYLQGFLTC